MPFYEYECENCKFYTEVLQKITDAPLRKCPSCGKNQLKKLVSAPVFRLKGAGWYETDFKSDKEAKRNLHDKADKDEAKTDGSGESEAGSKSEAKDAAKSDAKDDSAKSDSAKSDSAKGDSAKSASSEPTGSGKRSRISRPATTAVRSKSNGRTKKAARRAPAVRRRGR